MRPAAFIVPLQLQSIPSHDGLAYDMDDGSLARLLSKNSWKIEIAVFDIRDKYGKMIALRSCRSVFEEINRPRHGDRPQLLGFSLLDLAHSEAQGRWNQIVKQ